MTQTEGNEKRADFRLKFREHYRPKIRLTRRLDFGICDETVSSYEVIDISERGIRFLYTSGLVENPVEGVVLIRDLDPIEFSGTMLRICDSEICLFLDEAIPFFLLVEEERYLKQRYATENIDE